MLHLRLVSDLWALSSPVLFSARIARRGLTSSPRPTQNSRQYRGASTTRERTWPCARRLRTRPYLSPIEERGLFRPIGGARYSISSLRRSSIQSIEGRESRLVTSHHSRRFEPRIRLWCRRAVARRHSILRRSVSQEEPHGSAVHRCICVCALAAGENKSSVPFVLPQLHSNRLDSYSPSSWPGFGHRTRVSAMRRGPSHVLDDGRNW
jgi:hypothetical protein